MKREKNNKISRRALLKLCACAPLAAIVVPSPGGVPAVHAALPGDKKMLIIYYSWSGNTRHMAEQIQSLTGVDIFELTTVTPYPKEYRPTTEQARRELDSGYRPPLSSTIDNLADYDTIFIGSPNWWATLAMPFFTFLEKHTMSGKTVVPFMTHEGSGFGRSLTDLRNLCPNATLLEGLAVRGGRVKDSQTASAISQWLKKIGMIL